MSIWLLILQNIFPEAIAALLTVASVTEKSEFSSGFWLFLAYSILLRLVWNSSILIHGLGHTLAIAIVDRRVSALNLTNILENRSFSAILKSLLPFNNLFIPLFANQTIPWLAAGNSTCWRIRVKALGGIVFNLLAIAIVVNLDRFLLLDNYASSLAFLSPTFIIANLLIAICSLSDITAFVTGIADCFYCGNFGFIAKHNPDDGKELLPERMVKISQQMGNETEIRGEQAGGGLVVACDREERVVFVGKKIVNQKRENLTKSLEAAFAPVRKKALAQGIKPLKSSAIGVWHYRYATSGSPPTELETHWHEWMSARKENVWQLQEKKWVCQQKNVNHRITHNGDFDAWTLFGKEIDNQTLGLWLERVLHTSNATKGDSPKIAGLMDLLITQGMWYASVRLAYQLAIATGIQAAFGGQEPIRNAPNTAPAQQDLTNWAEIFTSTFSLYVLKPDFTSSPTSLNHLEEDILKAIIADKSIAEWSEAQRVAFVRTAIEAFFNNDAYRATQIFLQKAQGSFGLVTVSTLEDEHLILGAKGQPMSIGFNREQGYMIYASEPAAVDRVLLEVSGSTRLDLDQKQGEIARVSADHLTIYAMNLVVRY
ncbi:MAG: hypothetical protein QNJ34_25875 [Xenococcaceae cyanobacterium MO_188.B29]|nr:hypothetical protein [Xenococcaceae cyanobacterium MO_188.B29]